MFINRNRAGQARGGRTRWRARLYIQGLESRLAPAQFIVTSAADSGAGTLRAAIISSNTNGQADTITFDPAVTTINLTTGQLTISEKYNLTVDGGGKVTINGAAAASATNRIFGLTANGSPTIAIKNITLAKGNTTSYGGAISVGTQMLQLFSVSLLNNTANNDGGAIYAPGNCTLSLNSCRLESNQAIGSFGGGLSVGSLSTSAILNVANCSILGNRCGQNGGGLIVYNSTVTIQSSTIAGNSAGAGGGGIELFGSSTTISNCSIVRNTAKLYGGGIDETSTAKITTITNCTIASNSAGFEQREAIYIEGPTDIRNCTITGNSGGISLTSSASVNITSSIVAANRFGSASNDFLGTGKVNGNNNLIGYSGVAIIGINNLIGTHSLHPLDPGLLPLGDYGGVTATIALRSNSPAINAGSVIAGITTDQRGYSRTYGSAPDIGAFEVQPPRVRSVVINDGSAQRSRVTSLTVNFDSAVSVLPSAFRLQRQSDGQFVDLFAEYIVGGPTTSVELTFSGALTDFGSLKDGRFTLSVLSTQVSNFVGTLDGNGDSVPGDDYILVGTPANGLFRLFGDSDGDGAVAANDLLQLRLAFGGTGVTFDFDGDGSVSASDFMQFRMRFGGSV